MPFNRAAISLISCNSPADGAVLAGKLSSASAWSGSTPPDLVVANGATVEVVWFAVSTAAGAAQAAVNANRTGLTGILSLNHTSAGTVTNSKH